MEIRNRNSENDSLLKESQKFYNPTTDFVIGIAFIILVVGNVLLKTIFINFIHIYDISNILIYYIYLLSYIK